MSRHLTLMIAISKELTLQCPATPKELKKFIELIPELHRYRQALLDQLND